jgi:hypothetical protein
MWCSKRFESATIFIEAVVDENRIVLNLITDEKVVVVCDRYVKNVFVMVYEPF